MIGGGRRRARRSMGLGKGGEGEGGRVGEGDRKIDFL